MTIIVLFMTKMENKITIYYIPNYIDIILNLYTYICMYMLKYLTKLSMKG